MTTYSVCCFRRRFRAASNEPSEAIGDVFRAYSGGGGGGVLSEEALRRFLREVQGEVGEDDLEELAREVMAFAAEQKLLKKGGGGLTVEGFHRWLCSDANAALDPRRRVSCLYITRAPYIYFCSINIFLGKYRNFGVRKTYTNGSTI